MTIEDLKRYSKLENEINLLDEEISELKNQHTMDVVRSSDSEFPYTEHSQKIYGNSNDTLSLIAEKQKEKAELQVLKNETERFIDDIQDRRIQRIIKLKYMKGYSWLKIASIMKLKNESTVRMMCTRFFDKKSS